MFPAKDIIKYISVSLMHICDYYTEAIWNDIIAEENNDSKFEPVANSDIKPLGNYKDKFVYILKKLDQIQQDLKIKLAKQIRDYELAEDKDDLDDPNQVLYLSHQRMFEGIWKTVYKHEEKKI